MLRWICRPMLIRNRTLQAWTDLYTPVAQIDANFQQWFNQAHQEGLAMEPPQYLDVEHALTVCKSQMRT